MRNPAKLTRLAQTRTMSLFFPGMRNRTRTPASGVNKMMLSKCWSILVSQVIAEEHERPEHNEQRVALHAAGLQDAHRVAQHLHEEGAEPHGAVDDPGVPPDGHLRAEPRQPARAVDAAVHHVSIEGPEKS